MFWAKITFVTKVKNAHFWKGVGQVTPTLPGCDTTLTGHMVGQRQDMRGSHMRLDIYLNYPGTCEEAFNLYEKELKGRITVLRKHADAPNANIPADWNEKVLHAQLELDNATLMGADIPNAQPVRSAYVSLTIDSADEAERLFGLLQQGGEVFMKMEKTFFAERFGMLRDRFGTSWMLLHGVRETAHPEA